MKQIHFILVLAIFLFSSSSCSEGGLFFGPGKATGVVKDATTDVPIANAQVILYEEDIEFLSPSSLNKIDETTSDKNGSFFFDFKHNRGKHYLVYVYHPDYMEHPDGYYIDDTYGKIDVEVFLQPKGNLKIRIKTINEYNAFDYISISDIGTFYGSNVDTTIFQTVYGNPENRLVWGVVLSGVPPLENQIEYVYCPAFDTTYYEILY